MTDAVPCVLHIDVSAREWVGHRTEQQDSFCFVSPTPSAVLALVADGMGGGQGGKEASQILARNFHQLANMAPSDVASGTAEQVLLQSLSSGQKELSQYAQTQNMRNMGSTFAALAITETDISWVSVGDSLILRWRDGAVSRLNADHSYWPVLEELVRRGEMSASDARQDPRRSALRSVVSQSPPRIVENVTRLREIEPGDCYIIASDGLLTLSLDEIGEIITLHHDQSATRSAEALLQAVQNKRQPQQDNTTLILISIRRAELHWITRLMHHLGLLGGYKQNTKLCTF